MRPYYYFFLVLSTGMLAMMIITFTILASAYIPAGERLNGTPTDYLQSGQAHDTIALSGIDPQSAKAIDKLNADLPAWDDKSMVDLGHYSSEERKIKQANMPTAIDLKNWSDGIPEFPKSIVRT